MLTPSRQLSGHRDPDIQKVPVFCRPALSAAACVALFTCAVVACSPTPASEVRGLTPVDDPTVVFPATNRPDVRGASGAVSSGHPLASAAGYEVLRRGGNAVDAAVTMAGVLAVVRPHMNGVGGDAFAIFYSGESGEIVGMNGSGRSGALATPDFFRTTNGTADIPETGARSVSVPGAVAAWADAVDRFGTLSLAEALEPAIRYAREGFPVSTRLASDFREQSGALSEAGLAQYLPGGSPPPVGSLLENPALAVTLERIAAR